MKTLSYSDYFNIFESAWKLNVLTKYQKLFRKTSFFDHNFRKYPDV